MISWTEYLQIWCSVNNVKFGGIDELPLDNFVQMVPIPGLAKELGEMMLFISEFGYDGGAKNMVHTSDAEYGYSKTTWEDYIKGEDWTSVLTAEPSKW